MQQLVYFLRKYKYFLYFLFLEIIAAVLIINNHSFHKSKFISSANAISGELLYGTNKIKEYFYLKAENQSLLAENTILRNKLEQFYTVLDSTKLYTVTDTLEFKQKYQYINGKIISNNYHTSYNFLTINRGKKHGITPEMAVINNKGIIGITENISEHYTRIQSILNKNSKVNARLKNSHHFGTLEWDGNDYRTVQLTDIPRQSIIKVGDTIITGGKSSIFPEGIPIGVVKKTPEKVSAFNTIEIELFNDMSNIGNAYIITNFYKNEIKMLNTQDE